MTAVRAAVADLPAPPPLEDSLAICLLVLDQEPERYERAALRWLGRLLLERRGMNLRHAETVAAYLAACAQPALRDSAIQALTELGPALGLPRLRSQVLRSRGG